MSAHRHRATYNGILFNGIFGGDDPEDGTQQDLTYEDSDFRLYELDATRLSVSDLHEMRQWMEGATPNESFEGIRLLNGRGLILGKTPGDVEDRAWALGAAFSPANVMQASTQGLVASFPDEPIGVLPFDVRRDRDGLSPLGLRWYCRPFIGRPIVIGKSGEGLSRPFQFQLVSFVPTAFGQDLRFVPLADRSGGANVVTNDGTATTMPQVQIILSGHGNATTTLHNETTGQIVVFDLSAGLNPFPRQLWVMADQGEIIDTVRDSRYFIRKAGFVTNLYLVPGSNIITWDKPSNVTSVTFVYRDAYA